MSAPTIPTVAAVPQDPTFDQEGDEEFFDSYAFDQTFRFYFPDKKQYIEFRQMNEGDKLAYEKSTNRDLSVDRKTDTARFKIDQGGDRHTLIKQVVCGWYVVSRNPKTQAWEQMTFNSTMLASWLQVTSPKLVANLYDEIIKKNPGVLGDDATAEDIRSEIEDLQQQLVEKEKEERGNA